jgi:hypothetical protein
MILSLEDLSFRVAIINVELDEKYYTKQDYDRVLAAIHNSIKATNIEFNPTRIKKISDWKAFFERPIFDENFPLFYTGNHDHIYLAADNRTLEGCLSAFRQLRSQHNDLSIIMSHWAEYFSYRRGLLANFSHGFIHRTVFRDSMAVYSPALLRKWIFRERDTDRIARRLEELGYIAQEPFLQIVPVRELFRHFDGGSHFGVTGNRVSPLRIPPGLVDGKLRIVVDYGTNLTTLSRYPSDAWLRLGPRLPYLSQTPDGVDLPWTSSEVPLYLSRRASNFCVEGELTEEVLYYRASREISSLRDFIDPSDEMFFNTYPASRKIFGLTDIKLKPSLAPRVSFGRTTSTRIVFKSEVSARSGTCFVLLLNTDVLGISFLEKIPKNVPLALYFFEPRLGGVWPIQRSNDQLVNKALFSRLVGLSLILYDFVLDKGYCLRLLTDDLPYRYICLIDNTVPGATAALSAIADIVVNESSKNDGFSYSGGPLLKETSGVKLYYSSRAVLSSLKEKDRNYFIWESTNLSEHLENNV